MRTFSGLASFARFMGRASLTHNTIMEAAVGVAAENVRLRVHATFGDERKLAPLTPTTLFEKQQKGYPYPEAPLIATGHLRDTIRIEHAGPVAAVGSTDMRMLYHELGVVGAGRGHTVSIPPRPVFAIATAESQPETEAIMMAALGGNLGVRGITIPNTLAAGARHLPVTEE
jgi:phage gpG-like protein